jgi:hypothetical protein
VLLVSDHPGRETVLEQMALAVVTVVESLRVLEAEPVHAAGELLLRGLHDHVKVVRHQAPGLTLPPEVLLGSPAVGAERLAVVVVPDDRRTVDAADGDVEDPVRELVPRPARHRFRT